ncbi:MAG: HAD family hydrolase [Firmicutes bacterium]|nr:HAD family hydrolase [Bacillota bacterium]MCL1953546.1 HAD family hydrolase [Bacillota bacterium]
MKYNLFISDFDSTLNYDYDNYIVSQRTLNAIDNYRKAGGKFVLSTGRVWCNIQPYLQRYSLDVVDLPIVCSNGSVMYSAKTGEKLWEAKLSNAQTIQIMQYAYSIGEHVQVDSDSVMFVQQNDLVQTYLEFDKLEIQKTDDLLGFVAKMELAAHCCGILCQNHTVQEVKVALDNKFDFIDSTVCGHNLVMITSKLAGKGNGALVVAKMLGIPIQNTICIGDSHNDVSMIQIAGLGIAMQNANPEVQSVAKMIAGDCNQEGVAEILELATCDQL